jgi:p-hydroxybenzoate 3-monooxygenase
VSTATLETTVGIVGGGPAGLMLSHLLGRCGVANVVVDNRTRDLIEHTHRAGILEQGSVRLLVDSGVSDRVLRDGDQHEGIELRFRGESHRIHFQDLVGASVWLYPQTDVFADLVDARTRDGGDVRFGVSGSRVLDPLTDRPGLAFTDIDGRPWELRCEVLVGADGSRSMTRHELPNRRQYAREYPFAWFGILCEAPHSAPELIYTRSERGFALISQRTESLQRMYFQCAPDEDPDAWSDDRIWEELQARLAGVDGFRLREGPVVEKTVLPFRSFVCEPMRYGRVLLAGDAAHTVPPTGAKGLNLALADVRVLAEVLEQFARSGDSDVLDGYTPRALSRVWKAQHFSYWMTTMLHQAPRTSEFDDLRQLGELESLVRSEHGRRYLAECYTGWPFHGEDGR